MNYRNLVPLLATILIISGCDQLQTALDGSTDTVAKISNTAAESTAAPGGKVLATVNGAAITQDVLDVYAKSRKSQGIGDDANTPQMVLDELISLELVRQEGEKNGAASRPLIIAVLDQQRRTAIASAAISDFAKANETTDEEARKVYDEKMGGAGKEFNARHILLKTREEAVDVINALDGGADFSELAKEKSTGPSGKSGGNLGWFSPGQMVKPFSDATAALEAGSYSKEPVETQFGWHVIIHDDSRDVTPPPFEDVKARLKVLIANQKLQAHIKEIRAAADVNIIEE